MLINLSDDDIEIVGNNKDDNELMQEMSKKDSMRYTTKVYYNRGLSERSDNSSSDEERKRRHRRRDEIYKPAYCDDYCKTKANKSYRDKSAQEKHSEYMSYDLLNLTEDERRRCDRTLPEPLLKTPVLPRILPLTSTRKKENVERSEKERYLQNRNIDRKERRESGCKHDNEREYSRRRTSGYVSFNTEKDKTRSEEVISSDDENGLPDLPNKSSKVELKYSRARNDKTRRSVSRNEVSDENSGSDFFESERERYPTRKSSRKFQPLKPRRSRDAIKSSHLVEP